MTLAIEIWREVVDGWISRIESGIPIPKPIRETWAPPYKEIAENMKAGDSIVMDNMKHALNLRAAIYAMDGRASIRVDNNNKMRIWRIK